MIVSVKFFATYKKIAGAEQADFELPEGTTVAQLLKIMADKYKNDVINREESLLIVNEKIALRDQVLQNGDTVMLFHHFAGG